MTSDFSTPCSSTCSISYADGSLLLDVGTDMDETCGASKNGLAGPGGATDKTVDKTVGRSTLPLEGLPFVWDSRVMQWRAPAYNYRGIVTAFHDAKHPLQDQARGYSALTCELKEAIVPRSHQTAALKAWVEGGKSGVVQLPTGAGKTILAVLSLVYVQRETLIVVPTIDLMHQWSAVLQRFFGDDIGQLGGGQHHVRPLTVATYDSAAIHIDHLGAKFGYLIFDECHHLPSPVYRQIASSSIAPFRLGLSATVERADGKESDIYELIGPLIYDGTMKELGNQTLSPYDVVNIQVDLSPKERAEYQHYRDIYVGFVKRFRIDFSRGGWQDFVMKSARLPGGREAMDAYRRQKKIAQAAEGKLNALWLLLCQHGDDRMIIFTDENEMAYRIGKMFFLPVITHLTKKQERQKFLHGFRDGDLKVLVTSKVLNEGVDVPDANVGVVFSGSGSVREHVQRLGRILRHQPGKRAVLYELVSQKTNEVNVNQRRRQHHAYQRSHSNS